MLTKISTLAFHFYFYLFYFYLFLFLGISCTLKTETENTNVIKVSGKIINPKDNSFVFIYLLNGSQQEQVVKIMPDTEGYFETNLQVSMPTFFKINFYNNQENVFIAFDKDIEIEADGNQHNGFFEIKNSVENKRLADWNKLSFQLSVEEYRLLSLDNSNSQDFENGNLNEETFDFLSRKEDLVIRFIDSALENKSIVSLLAISLLDINDYLSVYEKVLFTLGEHYPDMPALKTLSKRINAIKELAIGRIPPNIQLLNPENKSINLYQLKNKYVLIDFWASWCIPCRQQNPDLLALYELFKSQDFEIFGVSLDDNKQAWLKAIKKDKLPWLQGSDLKGWQSELAETYQISFIPNNLLLNKKGEIIAKNISINELKLTLTDIFLN